MPARPRLFNVVSRIYDPTTGRVIFDGVDLLALAPHRISTVGIFRTFQNLALWPRMTVIENVMAGTHTSSKQNFVDRGVQHRSQAGGEAPAGRGVGHALRPRSAGGRVPALRRPAVRYAEARSNWRELSSPSRSC